MKAHGKEVVQKENMREEGINNTRKKEQMAGNQWKEFILEWEVGG